MKRVGLTCIKSLIKNIVYRIPMFEDTASKKVFKINYINIVLLPYGKCDISEKAIANMQVIFSPKV